MPVSWNAAMDQRLLLAVLAAVRVDNAAVAERWQALYNREDIPQPTARAITEHIIKLKERTGISTPNKRKGGKPLSTSAHPSAASGPSGVSKGRTPRTSSSGGKRAKFTISDGEEDDDEPSGIKKFEKDDDDYDDDVEMDLFQPAGDFELFTPETPTPSRTMRRRRMKPEYGDVAQDTKMDIEDFFDQPSAVPAAVADDEDDDCIVVASHPAGSLQRNGPGSSSSNRRHRIALPHASSSSRGREKGRQL